MAKCPSDTFVFHDTFRFSNITSERLHFPRHNRKKEKWKLPSSWNLRIKCKLKEQNVTSAMFNRRWKPCRQNQWFSFQESVNKKLQCLFERAVTQWQPARAGKRRALIGWLVFRANTLRHRILMLCIKCLNSHAGPVMPRWARYHIAAKYRGLSSGSARPINQTSLIWS